MLGKLQLSSLFLAKQIHQKNKMTHQIHTPQLQHSLIIGLIGMLIHIQHHQMVLNKLLSVICNFISLKGQPRLKEAPASFEVIEPHVAQKLEEGLAESSTGEGEFCCVCLSGLEEEEETSLLPCQHKFHKECVERWFSACKKTCPICRFSMEEDKYYEGEVLTEEMLIYFSSFHASGF